MIREKTLKKNEVLTDMSQFSIESGRLSIEKQYENLLKERQVLSDRKLELEKMLSDYRLGSAASGGRMPSNQQISRRKIVEELHGIQKRLVEIKPNMKKIKNALFREQEEILEDVLVVLKRIETAINK